MRVWGVVRGAAGPGGWVSARGWCAVVVAVVGMPLVTAAHAPAAVGYRVTRTILVGEEPDGVAVDPATRSVYVANSCGAGGGVQPGSCGTVSVIDAATGTVTRTIPVGRSPYGVAVDPAARTVYVPNAGDGTVSVIDAATGTVTGTVPVGAGPDAVAVDPGTHAAYVANEGAGTVSVISRCM
jgi:YVTN family beta-propeller protein